MDPQTPEPTLPENTPLQEPAVPPIPVTTQPQFKAPPVLKPAPSVLPNQLSKDDILLKNRPATISQVGKQTPEELGKALGTKLKARAALFGTKKPERTETLPKEKGGVSQIRTFRGDLEQAVEHQHVSVVTAVAAEQEKHAKEFVPEERKPIPVLNILLTIGSLVLVLGGIGLVGYVIYIRTPAGPVEVQTPAAPLVFVEKNTKALAETANRKNIIAALTEVSNQNITLGTMVGVQLAEATTPNTALTSTQFLTDLEADVDPSLIRSLEPNMLIGLYGFGTTYPFLVFKTNAYEQAFSGMLKWEGSMRDALAPFLPTTNIPLDATFTDSVIKNKDVRLVKNTKGETAFLYSFPDPHTLIITTNEDTFIELVRRLGNTKNSGG